MWGGNSTDKEGVQKTGEWDFKKRKIVERLNEVNWVKTQERTGELEGVKLKIQKKCSWITPNNLPQTSKVNLLKSSLK